VLLLGLLLAIAGDLLLLGLALAGMLVAALDGVDAALGAAGVRLRALLLAALRVSAGDAIHAASSGPVLADSAPARFFSVLRLSRRCWSDEALAVGAAPCLLTSAACGGESAGPGRAAILRLSKLVEPSFVNRGLPVVALRRRVGVVSVLARLRAAELGVGVRCRGRM
jgi:hypothetical protein